GFRRSCPAEVAMKQRHSAGAATKPSYSNTGVYLNSAKLSAAQQESDTLVEHCVTFFDLSSLHYCQMQFTIGLIRTTDLTVEPHTCTQHLLLSIPRLSCRKSPHGARSLIRVECRYGCWK